HGIARRAAHRGHAVNVARLTRRILRESREQTVKEIQKRVRPGHTEHVGGTVVASSPGSMTATVRLDGGTTPVPVRMPLMPRPLVPGDKVLVDVGKGRQIIDKVLAPTLPQSSEPVEVETASPFRTVVLRSLGIGVDSAP